MDGDRRCFRIQAGLKTELASVKLIAPLRLLWHNAKPKPAIPMMAHFTTKLGSAICLVKPTEHATTDFTYAYDLAPMRASFRDRLLGRPGRLWESNYGVGAVTPS